MVLLVVVMTTWQNRVNCLLVQLAIVKKFPKNITLKFNV